MKTIDVNTLSQNVFSAIGKQWMLITAGDREKANAMTASWGGLGVLWNKNVATVYIRPQRYTYEFIEKGDYFTLSFLGEEWREALKLCGSKSGRDTDKLGQSGLSLAYGPGDAPYIAQAQVVLVCKKLYFDDIEPSHFLDGGIDEKNYPAKDYHRMYIGEIVEAYEV